MGPDVLLVAAGGLAREVHEACVSAARVVVGFLDDDVSRHGTSIAGTEVLGGLDLAARFPHAQLVLCAGSGRVREGLGRRLGLMGVAGDRFATVLHGSVRLPSRCRVGHGSVLLAGAVLTADVTIGEHCVVMPNTTLTHDDTLEDYVTVCAGVALGGQVSLGRGSYIGMNASVRQGLHVGADAVLGMGSVLLADLPPGQTWAGVPARALENSDS